MDRSAPISPARRPGVPALLLAVLLAAVLAGHLAWLAADSQPYSTTDAYAFLTHLLRFADGFPWGGDPGAAWRALGRLSHGGRPPLYQLLTWPFVAVLGGGEDAALAINLVALAVLGAALYRLGRRLAGPWAGLAAAALALGSPPVTHMARIYLPHLAATAAAAVSLALLVALWEERRPRQAVAFGVSLGIGLLLHPSFLWTMGPAAAAVGLALALRAPEGYVVPGAGARPARRLAAVLSARLRSPLLWRGLVPGAVAAAVIGASWYAIWGDRLLRLQRTLLSEELAEFRGARHNTVGYPGPEGGLGWYAATAPDALSWLLLAPILLGLAALLLPPRRSAAWVVAAALAGSYLALSAQTSQAWLYGLGLIPPAAALGAWGIGRLRPPALAKAAAVAVALAAALVFAFVSWGWGSGAAHALGAMDIPAEPCRFHRGFCADPPVPVARPEGEALAIVLDDPRCRTEPPCRLFAVYGAGIGRTLFNYSLARHWPDRQLRVHAQGEAVWGTDFPLAALVKSEYLAFVDLGYDPSPQPGQGYREAAVRLLRTPPPLFASRHETAARLEIDPGQTLVLLRRTAPPTVAEAEEVADHLAEGGIRLRQLGERGPLLEELRRRRRD